MVACGSSSPAHSPKAPHDSDGSLVGAAADAAIAGDGAPSDDGSATSQTWACLAPYSATTTRDPGLWPFAASSPWNTPIGDGARFEPSTDACSKDLAVGPATFWINSHEWSHPIYLAAATDPTVNLYRNGNLVNANVRCPADAQPALPAPPNTDAHLHIIDPSHQWLDEMWEASQTADGWNAQAWAKTNLSGPGVGQGGVRAYGGSAIGGLIRAGELTAGIRHALAFAIEQSQQTDAWVWPATSNDQAPAANYQGSIPMGQLVGIPPGVDLCGLGLSPAGLVVARALQDFGAYLVDTAGGFAFYAEPRVEDDTSSGEATLLGDARSDLSKIVPQLRCVANSAAATVGGGGVGRAPPAPSL